LQIDHESRSPTPEFEMRQRKVDKNHNENRNETEQPKKLSKTVTRLKTIVALFRRLLFDKQLLEVLSPWIVLIEICLCVFIIWRVKCELRFFYLFINIVPDTEIDWSTYMQQVACFANGTLDYTQIKGDTGPIVYAFCLLVLSH
jgi:alpha-1,3-mannosyltransferase